MDEGALKRIGALFGLFVAVPFGLWQGFSGLVLGRCLGLGDTRYGGQSYAVEGAWARGYGLVWLAMTGIVAWSLVRQLRETG